MNVKKIFNLNNLNDDYLDYHKFLDRFGSYFVLKQNCILFYKFKLRVENIFSMRQFFLNAN
jgi:hypothetical protein